MKSKWWNETSKWKSKGCEIELEIKDTT